MPVWTGARTYLWLLFVGDRAAQEAAPEQIKSAYHRLLCFAQPLTTLVGPGQSAPTLAVRGATQKFQKLGLQLYMQADTVDRYELTSLFRAAL